MGEIDGKKLNLEIPLSDKFEVSYDYKTKTIDINQLESKIPNDFYGKNISNLNLIVGKNGSWKSTFLNLIGTKIRDRNSLFSFTDQWFIIYYNQNNEYVFEGSDYKMVADFSNLQSLALGYWITANYNEEEKSFENINYIQDKKNGYLHDNLTYLYQPTDINKFEYFSSPDNTVSFDRNYLYETSYNQEYSFLCEDFKKFASISHELSYSISNKSNNNFFYENRSGLNLNLYGNNELSFKLFKLTSIGKSEEPCKLTEKESYIIYFLEQRIIEAWNSKEEKTYYETLFEQQSVNWTENDLKKINQITKMSEWESFEDQKKYLLKILKELIYVLDSAFLEGEEETSFYYRAYSDFINHIDKINPKYFKNERELSFPIRSNPDEDNIREKSQDFINLLKIIDEYTQAGVDKKNDLVNHLLIGPSKLSDGQVSLVKQFSKIKTGLEKKIQLTNLSEIVLLIDEPEVYLHPNWSRKYLAQLLKYINGSKTRYKVHIIITTHSPYLVSDTLGSSVLKIKSI
ncbi:AAA family ATPase [Lactococcus lactis]|uniref:AAA family ATPase n=1 Tax=Lactococcus lactis TaxID=1358 RepID=UPI00207367EE|nr:AAA family ATPase [Lactococcus lactis]